MREKRKGRCRQWLADGLAGGLFVIGNGAKAGDFTFVLWACTGTTVGEDARRAGGGVAGEGVASGRVAGGTASCQWVDKKIWEKKKMKEWGKFLVCVCV